MNADNEYCKLAALMKTGNKGNYGLLDYRFVEFLGHIAIYVQNAGGEINSRQIIALVIAIWEQTTGFSALGKG